MKLVDLFWGGGSPGAIGSAVIGYSSSGNNGQTGIASQQNGVASATDPSKQKKKISLQTWILIAIGVTGTFFIVKAIYKKK